MANQKHLHVVIHMKLHAAIFTTGSWLTRPIFQYTYLCLGGGEEDNLNRKWKKMCPLQQTEQIWDGYESGYVTYR